jgi:HSP20 family protein
MEGRDMRSLIPWRSGGGLLSTPDTFWPELEGMFRRFFGEPRMETTNSLREGKLWAPRVDMEESEKEIVVKADLPGVDPKDVDVSIVDGALVLRGEKKEEREEKDRNYHRMERFVGEFYREVPLPAGADPDKITACSCKGVIKVTIPKKPEVLPKKIEVKAE